MNEWAVIFLVINSIAVLTLPRQWASIPLLVGTCYMTLGQSIVLGPFNLSVFRLLLGVATIRVIARNERPVGAFNTVDRMLLVWAVWIMFASLFHEFSPGSGPVFISGIVFNIGLAYFLFRVFCRDLGEIVGVVKVTAIVLVPVALEMVLEKLGGLNAFSVFGGVSPSVVVRNGIRRAQGPFGHPILAGSVGAACLPLMLGIWREHRQMALVGVAACVTLVVSCASSGPIMSLMFGVTGMMMWRFRHQMRRVRMLALGGYLLLELVMTRPAYFVISKIDLSNGSTGYHRAALIQSTIEHKGEWWLFGTDHTRHWMPTGVSWSENHADLTNYFIQFGVWGGLAALLLVVAIIWRCFFYVGGVLRRPGWTETSRFTAWCLGAALFAQALTAISVSFFDQSQIFFWMNVAMISSLHSAVEESALREAWDHASARDASGQEAAEITGETEIQSC